MGFPLPGYYKQTMMAYPFTEDEFTTPYFLPNNPKTIIKLNSNVPNIEGIARGFCIGGELGFYVYLVDATLSASPVYMYDLKTHEHSIKASTWSGYLDLIRKEMKEVQEEEAFEQKEKGGIYSPKTKKNVWTKDYSPTIGRILGPLFGVLLLYGGIKTMVTKQYHYRSWIFHGTTAEMGGIMLLLIAYLMFRGCFWTKKWNPFDVGVGICAGVIFLGFLALEWTDIL